MKITCEHCATQYHIPDDKVAGKAFKIRCKQCGQFIVIRGTLATEGLVPIDGGTTVTEGNQSPASSQPLAAVPLENEARWYAVIRQERVGPFSTETVRAQLNSGEIMPSTYVWREGFTDWTEARLVPELQNTSVLGSGPAPTPVQESDPHTDWLLNEPKKGVRNENSVLFSLGDLQPSPTTSRPAPALRKEGSGLIDIRNLATQTFAQTNATPVQMPTNVSVPAFSHPPVPVLAPVPPSSGIPQWMMGLLIGLGVLSLGLLSVVIWVETRSKAPAALPATTSINGTASPTGTSAVPPVMIPSAPSPVLPPEKAQPVAVPERPSAPVGIPEKPPEVTPGKDKVPSAVKPPALEEPDTKGKREEREKAQKPSRPKESLPPPLPDVPTAKAVTPVPTKDAPLGGSSPKENAPSTGTSAGEDANRPARPQKPGKPKDELDELLDGPSKGSEKSTDKTEEAVDNTKAYQTANALLNGARNRSQTSCAAKLSPDKLSESLVFEVKINDHRSATISGGSGSAASECVRSILQGISFPQFSAGNGLRVQFPVSLRRG